MILLITVLSQHLYNNNLKKASCNLFKHYIGEKRTQIGTFGGFFASVWKGCLDFVSVFSGEVCLEFKQSWNMFLTADEKGKIKKQKINSLLIRVVYDKTLWNPAMCTSGSAAVIQRNELLALHAMTVLWDMHYYSFIILCFWVKCSN